MPSHATNEATRREWRELGYFYDLDDEAKEWLIIGTKTGISKFASSITAFAANLANDCPAEHQHFGPYMTLEIGTWYHAEITDRWIAGLVQELLRLAEAIRQHVQESAAGRRITLRSEFSPLSPYELVLEVRDDDFDPGSRRFDMLVNQHSILFSPADRLRQLLDPTVTRIQTH